MSASVTVGGGVSGGTYTNTTRQISADINGSPTLGNTASANLNVSPAQALTFAKAFPDGNVNAGDQTTLRFTISNPNISDMATDIAFLDELTDGSAGFPPNFGGFLPFPVSVTLPPVPDPPCGPGSALSLVSIDTDRQGLQLAGGNLAGLASCTFEVMLTIPADMPGGTYTNTTGDLSYMFGSDAKTTGPASASLTVNNALDLTFTKTFVDDNVLRGATTNIQFDLINGETGDLTNISFTDDLESFFPGTTFDSIISNTCGFGVSGTSTATFTGGALVENASCSITIAVTMGTATLPTPNADDGLKTNTTSDVTASISGATAAALGGSADSDTINVVMVLPVDPPIFAKEFVDTTVLPGQATTLRFSIQNQHPTNPAAISFFTDDLAQMLPGTADIEATGTATFDDCGGSISGTTFLTYTGGGVPAATTCTIEVPVLVPLSAPDDTYTNVTGFLSTSQGTSDPAVANLTVAGTQITLTKEFTDDPVAPGDPVTLEFVLQNENATTAASDIAFDDDLSAMDLGVGASDPTFDSLLFNDCGGVVGGTGTALIDVSGGSLVAGASCTIRVSVTIPGDAEAGPSTNTTGYLSAMMSGLSVFGDAASDTLDVSTIGTTFSKSFDDREIAGGTAVLSFSISNPNAGAVTSLAFTDDLDAVVTGLVATSLPTAPCGAGSSISGTSFLTFTGGEVAGGATCNFDVEVMVPLTATTGTYPNTTSNLTSGGLFSASPATADLEVYAEADVSVTKTDGVTTANPGSSLTYTIVAANAGPSPDPSVNVNDTLPSDLTCTYTSVAAGGATGNTAAGAGNLAETLSMPSGSSVTYTLSCNIDSSATGTLSNTVNALTSISDPGEGNNEATDNDTVLSPEADISITKSDGVTSATPGSSLIYTIVASNAGPSDDSTVSVADTFPSDLSCGYTSVAAGGASGNTAAGTGDLSETLSMPAGSSVTYTATCSIAEAATGTLSNTATASGSVTDPNTGNNSATDADTVLAPEADVSITKTDGVTTATPGGSLTYSIVASNAGPSTDPSVSVSDTFPDDLSCTYTSVAAGGATGNTAAGAGDISETLAMPSGSSVTYTATCNISASATGTLSNTATISASVTDPDSGNNSATDGDTVLAPEADISITKTDGLTTVKAGDSLTYTIVASNAGPSDDPSVSVVDTFPSLLTCGYTSVASGGATGNTASGSADISDTLGMPVGASVTYTATCTVDVAATGTLSNTATAAASVTDPASGNNSATDSDTVVDPINLVFTKVFAPDTIDQGGVSTLTFTIDNTYNVVAASSMAFTDSFPSGVVVAPDPGEVNNCGGTFTATAGATSVDLTGGSVSAGSSCTLSVTVRALESGNLTNTTGDLTSTLPTVSGASDILSVNPAGAPVFSKVFDPDTIVQGGVTSLMFTIDNSGKLIDATGLAFTDDLSSIGLSVAATPNASNTCNGTFAPTSGDTLLSLSGGDVGVNSSCTLSVDVRGVVAVSHTNTTSDLSSSLGTATAATDDLTVTAVAPTFSKAFSPATIDQGGMTTLTFTIDNSANLIEADSLAFTDDLGALSLGLSVAEAPNVSNTCNGTFAPSGGDTLLDFSGGDVAIGSSCTISVDVRGVTPGTDTNTTSSLSSSLSDVAPATADLTVNSVGPTFSKVFTPDTIVQGEITTLIFTVENSANLIEATSLAFTDDLSAMALGVSVADPPNIENTCNGTFAPSAGDTSLSFTGGDVGIGVSCDITVDVRALVAGTATNTSSTLTSSLDEAPAATDDLTVDPAPAPGFTKSFSPTTVDQGQTSVLTFTVDNSGNAIEATSLTFSDDFPTGMVVADSPSVSNSCGGTVTATAGAATMSLAGGAVAEGASCTVSVTVQALANGTLDNISSTLVSSITTADEATASLNVTAVPLGLTMTFSPSTITEGDVSTLRIGMRNLAPIAASSILLTDNLPTGMTIAAAPNTVTDCTGGTLSAPAGGSTISYTGGSLAANGSCSVQVDVTSSTVGSNANSTDAASSNLGTSTPASATLTVEAITVGNVAFVVDSDTDGSFDFSSATSVLNALIEVNGGTGTTGLIEVDAGTYAVNASAPVGIAITAISCDDTNSSGDATSGDISVDVSVLETVTCTLTAKSSLQPTIDAINKLLKRRAGFILSSEPEFRRRIDRLTRGFGNASPLTFSTGDLKSFLPFTANVPRGSNDYRFSTSLLQVRQAGASIALAHGSHKDVAYVDNYRFDAWFEASHREYDFGADGEGKFTVAYLGADYIVNPDLLVGIMVQYDDIKDTTATSTASGQGWMVGPYLTARLGSNLYFDGRLAAGKSTNKISPFNTYTDTFGASRWLAMARLIGEFKHGNWTILPNASLAYFEETQHSYTDSTGATIPSQTVRLGEIKLGPTFTGHFEGANGEVYKPYIGFDAIYNIGDTTGVTLTNPSSSGFEGWRGRVQAGVTMTDENGVKVGFGGTYDGLFQSDFDAWGFNFELEFPFYKAKAK